MVAEESHGCVNTTAREEERLGHSFLGIFEVGFPCIFLIVHWLSLFLVFPRFFSTSRFRAVFLTLLDSVDSRNLKQKWKSVWPHCDL